MVSHHQLVAKYNLMTSRSALHLPRAPPREAPHHLEARAIVAKPVVHETVVRTIIVIGTILDVTDTIHKIDMIHVTDMNQEADMTHEIEIKEDIETGTIHVIDIEISMMHVIDIGTDMTHQAEANMTHVIDIGIIIEMIEIEIAGMTLVIIMTHAHVGTVEIGMIWVVTEIDMTHVPHVTIVTIHVVVVETPIVHGHLIEIDGVHLVVSKVPALEAVMDHAALSARNVAAITVGRLHI